MLFFVAPRVSRANAPTITHDHLSAAGSFGCDRFPDESEYIENPVPRPTDASDIPNVQRIQKLNSRRQNQTPRSDTRNHQSHAMNNNTTVKPSRTHKFTYRTRPDKGREFDIPKIIASATTAGAMLPAITAVFQYTTFYERSGAAGVSRAFYIAYHDFIDNAPILKLVLDGDWINFIRAYNRMSYADQCAATRSRTFSQIMIFGGVQTTKLLNAMGGISSNHHNECSDTIAIKFHGRAILTMGGHIIWPNDTVQTKYLGLGACIGVIACGRYDLLDQIVAQTCESIPAKALRPHSDTVAASIAKALIEFHQRCVPETQLCMFHHTHAGLPTAIPQVIGKMHDLVIMNKELLSLCLAACRGVRNSADESWLQQRYPNLFFRVISRKMNLVIKCNIKHVDLTDTFGILNALDKKTIVW